MLPDAATLRKAIEIYLEVAYGPSPPPAITERYLPPADANVERWLEERLADRDPPHGPLREARSLALRVGNRRYPFMKLRLSRPPGRSFYVFSVDAHDACLHASTGSSEQAPLEQLKQFNVELGRAVLGAWDAEGILTDRGYLRQWIAQVRRGRAPH